MSQTISVLAALALVVLEPGKEPSQANAPPRTSQPTCGGCRGATEDEMRAHFAAKGLQCRENVRVSLRTGKETRFDRTLRLTPPQIDDRGVLTLFPGDKAYVEAEGKGDDLVLRRLVASPEHPERTLTFSFEQMEGKMGMLLVVTNPFDRIVKYDVLMMPLDGSELPPLVRTSSCPVVVRGQGMEMWPHPIFQLLLSRFRFIPSSTGLKCE